MAEIPAISLLTLAIVKIKEMIKNRYRYGQRYVADAKVLSGNMDDKTYNNQNLEDLDRLLTQMDVNRNELFYYIADSALFSETNIEKANQNDIRLIIQMPDNTNLAVVYLLLIALMILTIAEKVVRDDLKKTDDLVYGIDNRKLKRPTLTAILQIIDRVRIITYKTDGKIRRQILNLDDSCKKIIGFLGLSENCFAWNGDSKAPDV
ncbi:hypothetical protein ACETAC_00475 [Aceticella autotrophica]|uniref:Uncharacterized protein n=1 Tax=Aceticella autotrophica TaxID=2755338 RepID=A0A975GAS2_9THEO|nr:hypothetical protein [Aceticella autotrophica]QSZ27446.1 hypothetical protein ACETAC_00475 [Aceticella autotrophica]